jgi:hypothetical protein
MSKLREFGFPVLVLGAWIFVSAYTLSSLGEAHARVANAQLPTFQAPAVEIVVPAPAKQEASMRVKASRKQSQRGPRV